MSHHLKLLNSKKAFTLMEVVLAMMIMASGLFILTNSWSGTYSRLQKTQVQVQLAALLERKIVEIEREYKTTSLESMPEEKSDDFGAELPDYSWQMQTQKLNIPDLSGIIGAGSGEGQNMDLGSILKLFSEHLSKSVLEIKISVTYKHKKKPITVSVVIYKVDFERPLPMPGAAASL